MLRIIGSMIWVRRPLVIKPAADRRQLNIIDGDCTKAEMDVEENAGSYRAAAEEDKNGGADKFTGEVVTIFAVEYL